MYCVKASLPNYSCYGNLRFKKQNKLLILITKLLMRLCCENQISKFVIAIETLKIKTFVTVGIIILKHMVSSR